MVDHSLPKAPSMNTIQSAHRSPKLEKKARRQWLYAFQRNLVAYLFLLPALIVFSVFSWYPIVRGLILSFQKVNLLAPPVWVGLQNFRVLFLDPSLAVAWKNAAYYTLLGLLIGYLVPLILAVLVNDMQHGRSYFRLAFYLPVILPPMAGIILWKMGLFNSDWGLLNMGLQSLGLERILWLDSTQWAMPSLVIFATWANAGGTLLIYLAALQGVPAHLYDAAEIDGANIWLRFLHITLPEIRNIMLILFVLQIIGTMQVFTEPFVMTGGGPANATLTIIMLIYRQAFSYGNFGVASALGFMLFVVLVLFSGVYWWLTRKFAK